MTTKSYLGRGITRLLFLLLMSVLLVGCNSQEPGQTANRGQGKMEGLPETSTELNTQGAPEPKVHSSFDLSLSGLTDILDAAQNQEPQSLTPGIREAILGRAQRFLGYALLMLQSPEEDLILLDKHHSISQDFVPPDLVAMTDYPQLLLNRSDLSLRELIMPDLLDMVEAAKEDGVNLVLSSSYRSYDYQEGLFNRYVNELGEEEASRVSARPGTSQHQLGTVIDFGSITPEYAQHPGGLWLAEHAWRYGFSLSYPQGYEWLTGYDYEPWHFRWIGRTAALMEQEFFEGLQQRMLLFWDVVRDDLDATRLR